MYLHHCAAASNKPWETASGLVNTHPDQKCKISPVRDGVSFYFHVDFINLTDEELRLLCYALAPSSAFMHKIGMGKPIGLGSVKITPEGLFLIDRAIRYSVEGYNNECRYHKLWKIDNPERPLFYTAEFGSTGSKFASVNDLAAKYTPHPDIRKAIELLGQFPKHEVHYPRVSDGNAEDKLFQWFVANDKGSGRGQNKIPAQKENLQPITMNTEELPCLKRYQWNG